METPIVLLTGATGFIGGATLAQLRESYPDSGVLLFVRGATPAAATAATKAQAQAASVSCDSARPAAVSTVV